MLPHSKSPDCEAMVTHFSLSEDDDGFIDYGQLEEVGNTNLLPGSISLTPIKRYLNHICHERCIIFEVLVIWKQTHFIGGKFSFIVNICSSSIHCFIG